LGIVAAGNPIEAVLNYETVCVPRDMMRAGRMFALRVRGDSMIDEQIRDNDVIVLQSQQTAENHFRTCLLFQKLFLPQQNQKLSLNKTIQIHSIPQQQLSITVLRTLILLSKCSML